MSKCFEIRKVWGIGPFKRRKVLSSFDSQFVAEHVMVGKLLSAKKKGKRLELELFDTSTGHVIARKVSK